MKKHFRMNPILKKELMVGSRSIKMSLALAGINAFLVLIVILVMAVTNGASRYDGYGVYDYSSLVALFPLLGCVECGIISFIVPIITSGSISGEREKQTLDIMLTTPITPFQIALGKLGSAMAVVMMYMIASVPILAIAFVLGGMNWGYLFGLIGMLLVIGIYVGSVGILCSSLVKKSVVSTIMTIAIGIAIIVSTLVIFGVSMSFAAYRAEIYNNGDMQMGIIPFILFLNPYSGFFDFMVQSLTSESILEMIKATGDSPSICLFFYKHWIFISNVLNLLISLGVLKLASLRICATKNKRGK